MEVDTLYSQLYLNNRLDLNEFVILPLLLKKCLLKKVLLNIYNKDISKINDKHIEIILDLICSEKQNGSVNLPNNLVVIKYYNILEFSGENSLDDYDIIFYNELSKDDWMLLKVDNTDIIKSNYLIRLDSNEITLPLHIRNRKVGDKIALKNGTKKVGEILSESKMPKGKRDRYPIVCDNNGKILWIPGVKKGKFDKQIDQSYDIIIKYIKKGEKYEK